MKYGSYKRPPEGEEPHKFEVTLRAEDWLVQPLDRISSADYQLQDLLGPHGNYRTIRGVIWHASEAFTPQYVDKTEAPVVALLNTRTINEGGSEELIALPEDSKVDPRSLNPEERLVLVRLDRVSREQPLELTKIT